MVRIRIFLTVLDPRIRNSCSKIQAAPPINYGSTGPGSGTLFFLNNDLTNAFAAPAAVFAAVPVPTLTAAALTLQN